MNIDLKLAGQVIRATLADSAPAREFAAMLPLNLTMHELFKREKFGSLPRPVAAAQTQARICEAGDLICWTSGPDLTVFHRRDDKITTGRFHVLGRIDTGYEAFAAPGPLEVHICRSTTG